MTPPKVLIADSISQRGVDELARENALHVTVKTGLNERELVELIPPFSAVVVRSQTKVTAEILNAGNKLRVVGRAGVGVDNVDVETATRRRRRVERAGRKYHLDCRTCVFVVALRRAKNSAG